MRVRVFKTPRRTIKPSVKVKCPSCDGSTLMVTVREIVDEGLPACIKCGSKMRQIE